MEARTITNGERVKMYNDNDEKRDWLKVNRPCGRCKKYFSYTFGDRDAECPHCHWKVRDEQRKDDSNESER